MFRNPRTIFRLAMVTLLVMLVWPRLIDPYIGISPDWSDGIRGVFLGMTLGLLFLSMWLKRRGPQVT